MKKTIEQPSHFSRAVKPELNSDIQ